MTVVTLLTDFGASDGYVGAMKGVIVSRAPGARIIDIGHDIPPHDVSAGAWALREASATFPAGTIHVAVVDPGVGTDRRPLLMESAGMLYVGPDNGLLTWVGEAEGARAWCLDRPELFRPTVSATFHGRDIFASVAGYVASGRKPEDCGMPVRDWVRLPRVTVEVGNEAIVGRVVHVDRFGNLVTNIAKECLGEPGRWQVQVDGQRVGPLRRTFGDVQKGEVVAYVGSAGTVEIAVREGRAAADGRGLDSEVRLCVS